VRWAAGGYLIAPAFGLSSSSGEVFFDDGERIDGGFLSLWYW